VNLNLCLIFGAYFLGCIPFGLLITRWVRGVDIRTKGSGNIGASNVSRVCGRSWGRLTLMLDAAKGGVPCAFALCSSRPEIAGPMGLAAVLGHCWPVFMRFKGGKGVATSAGVMGVMAPWAALAGILSWLAIYRWRHQSSLASLVSCGVLLGALVARDPRQVSLGIALVGIIFLRHRENVRRLLAGEERGSAL
jgi:glycerol-3-phosphate acyltransferase PlsY